jgi:hypothetical protein
MTTLYDQGAAAWRRRESRGELEAIEWTRGYDDATHRWDTLHQIAVIAVPIGILIATALTIIVYLTWRG